jgi:hypothetical protein
MANESALRIPNSNVQKFGDSCFDYLNIEMVEYFVASTSGRREDLFLKLERIGYVVGQKLAER